MLIQSTMNAVGRFFNRYPVVFAAIAIYGYYLTTTLDFFKKSTAQASPSSILFCNSIR